MNNTEDRIRSAFRPYRSKIDLEYLASATAGNPKRRRTRRSQSQELGSPTTSTRVVAAVIALAVFAAVAVVFIVPALRLGTSRPAAGGEAPFESLWPVQTEAQLSTYQAQADAGSHPEALDPQKIAEAFAHHVLGWDKVFAFVHEDPISSLCGLPVPGTPAPEFHVGCWSPGPNPIVHGPDYTPPPIETFVLLPCEPGPCDIKFFSPVDVTVFQPGVSGPDGVWAVMAASNEWLDLSSVPGQILHDGATVNVSGAIAQGDAFRLGVSGVGSCAYADSTAAYDTNGTPPDAASLDAHLDVHLVGAAGCTGTSAGYVWAAESTSSLDGVDPLAGGGPELKAFSAVPVSLLGP
jgi:hypothetical protein